MAGQDIGQGRRILSVACVVALFGAAVAIYFRWARPALNAEGGSESDAVWLLCAKCDGESHVPVQRLATLQRDMKTGAYACPKCSHLAAFMVTMRCEKCGRLIPPQGPGSPLICPHCKQPLGGLKTIAYPNRIATAEQQPAAPAPDEPKRP